MQLHDLTGLFGNLRSIREETASEDLAKAWLAIQDMLG
jgi:hypothetical protein